MDCKGCRFRAVSLSFGQGLSPYGEFFMNLFRLHLIFSDGYCIMVSMFRERMFTVKNVKKLILVGVLLLALVVALAACDAEKPSEADTMDTSATEETTLGDTTQIPDTDAETDDSGDTAPEETAPESEPPSEEDSGEATAPDDTDTETPTEPEPEPEFTGPGKLVYTSNEGLRYLNNMGKEIGSAFEVGQYGSWKNRVITMGIGQVAVFVDWGWVAFDSKEYEFGYIVNGEEFFSESYAKEAEASVVDMAKKLGAKNCARFSGGLTGEVLKLGENRIQFCVRLDEGVVSVIRDYTVNLTQQPVRLDGSYWNVPIDSWTVSGHNPHIQDTSNGMVAAGGVEKGALLHQGAIGVGTVDLSKYSKVVIYFGCDSGAGTQNLYNNNPHNRIMLTKTDSNKKMSPDEADIIAYADYTLHGWSVKEIEIDLSKVNYKGPVYISVDALPGTFVLFSSIEFVVE